MNTSSHYFPFLEGVCTLHVHVTLNYFLARFLGCPASCPAFRPLQETEWQKHLLQARFDVQSEHKERLL